MQELARLQSWFESNCDESWEHSHGVKIDTLDNPGWQLCIDLAGTNLLGLSFDSVDRGDPESDRDWIHCEVMEGQFIAAGGAQNLTELVAVFLAWANA